MNAMGKHKDEEKPAGFGVDKNSQDSMTVNNDSMKCQEHLVFKNFMPNEGLNYTAAAQKVV